MNQNLEESTLEYFTQRASEFDKKYLGPGPVSISDPQAFRNEVRALSKVVNETCSGNLLDMACGTAFWLPHYAGNCLHITLFDQSHKMLVHAQNRAVSIGVTDRTTAISGDALSYKFREDQFDTVLVAFIISHFTANQNARFFRMLKSTIKPNGQILILDSVWNETRGQTRKKEGLQNRRLSDGNEFQIYKKYFTEKDLLSFNTKYGIGLSVEYFGKVFFAARAVIKK